MHLKKIYGCNANLANITTLDEIGRIGGCRHSAYSSKCTDSHAVILNCERPVNGWGQWSSCSKDCDGGKRTRVYKCDDKSNTSYGTCDESQIGRNQTDNCNNADCPDLFSMRIVGPDKDATPVASGLLQVFFKNETMTEGKGQIKSIRSLV